MEDKGYVMMGARTSNHPQEKAHRDDELCTCW